MSDLQKYADFDLIGGNFKKAKEELSKKGKELNQIVKCTTRKRLEQAFKKYNDKIKK